MKIVYWSPVHGQAGTTSNIIVSATLACLCFRQKVLLTQTHFNYNNLEAPFWGANSYDLASRDFYMNVGLDAIIRSFKAAKIDNQVLENCCPSLPITDLLLLPGTTQRNREAFDSEMKMVMTNLLRNMEEVCEIVFVDINSGNNELSKKLIANADLTVVNLSQNMVVTDMYFREFRGMIKGKVFYVFGNYDDKSKYNLNNIRRKFNKEIRSDNSGVIPYNTAFKDAQCDGRVVNFIKNNIKSKRNDENYYFIQKAVRTTEKLLKYAGVDIGTDERI